MKHTRVKDVVYFFCSKMDPDTDVVSLNTMQKLCYYAQGFSLAIFGEPLFQEVIYISGNGPYCEEVFQLFQKDQEAKSNNLDQYNKIISSDISCNYNLYAFLSKKEVNMLNEVWKVYGQFSGWKIRDLIWNDPCCEKYFHERRLDDMLKPAIISHEDMKKYFKTLVKEVSNG